MSLKNKSTMVTYCLDVNEKNCIFQQGNSPTNIAKTKKICLETNSSESKRINN